MIKSLEDKFEVIYLDIDEHGIIDLNQLTEEIDNTTILVSVMWVNNIIGTVQPIKEIQKIVSNYPKAKLHIDAVQGFGKVEPKFEYKDIDLQVLASLQIHFGYRMVVGCCKGSKDFLSYIWYEATPYWEEFELLYLTDINT